MRGTVVVSQLGARMHYAVPRILQADGRLERLYTDISAVRGWPRLLSLLPRSAMPAALRRLSGRVPAGIPVDKIRCFEGIGFSAALRRTLFASGANETAVALATARRFSRAVARSGFGDACGFYGMSGECLEQIQAARRGGLWSAVEQIVAPRSILDRLVAEEAARHSGWEPEVADDPLAGRFIDRETAEWFAADMVICPSEFVRQGIEDAGGPADRCVIVPYGIDASFHPPRPARRDRGPLKVLTIGAVGLRKGSPYVLEAARRLRGRAEFRLVGPVAHLPPAKRRELSEALDLVGQIPRAEIPAQYSWADVFLLPSVCEGSATVTYEALAAGLPVVTTPNAGSVVRHGVEGYLAAAGDADSICTWLDLLAGDRERLDEMARNARARAFDHDLSAYGRRLLDALARLETGRPACADGRERAA